MRFFQPSRLAPQVTRTPVEFTQAVEDRSPDAKLCIRSELHLLAAIEFLQRIDQSNDPGMHEILQQHVTRQAIVYAAGDVTDLGQLLHQQPFPLVLVASRASACLLTSVMNALSELRTDGGLAKTGGWKKSYIGRFHAGEIRRGLVED